MPELQTALVLPVWWGITSLLTRAATENRSGGEVIVSASPRNGLLLQLKVEGNTVTGFLGQDGVWGTPLKIELGTIDGNIVRFITVRRLAGRELIVYQWIAELIGDETLRLRGGNIQGGRGGEGRRLEPGRQAALVPAALPPLEGSRFRSSDKLRRVK